MTRIVLQARRRRLAANVIAVLVVLIFAWLFSRAAPGRQNTTTALLLLLLAPYALLLLGRGKRLWLAAVPLLVFWIPGSLGVLSFAPLRALSLVEALVLLALFVVALRALSVRDNLRPLGLRSFPWVGFLAFFAGAALTSLYAFRTGEELPLLRVFVFLPFVLGLLVMAVVRDAKEALKMLWVLVAAATVLGIVFLLGSRGVGPFSSSEYATGSGRASLSFSIPYLGSLVVNPASAGDKFAQAFAVAWFLLLTSNTGAKRLAAGTAAFVFVAVVVSAQGRAGIVACALSMALFGVWAMRKGSSNRLLALTATLAGLASTIGSTVYLASKSTSSAFAARIFVLFSDPLSDPNAIGRIQGWREGFDLAVSHPLGIGLFSPPYGADSTWATHNLWLYTALSLGWLGLAGLVWILVRFGRDFIAGLRSADVGGARLSMLGLALLLNILVTGMTSPLVSEPYSAVLMWTPLWIAFTGVVRCRVRLSTVDRYHQPLPETGPRSCRCAGLSETDPEARLHGRQSLAPLPPTDHE